MFKKSLLLTAMFFSTVIASELPSNPDKDSQLPAKGQKVRPRDEVFDENPKALRGHRTEVSLARADALEAEITRLRDENSLLQRLLSKAVPDEYYAKLAAVQVDGNGRPLNRGKNTDVDFAFCEKIGEKGDANILNSIQYIPEDVKNCILEMALVINKNTPLDKISKIGLLRVLPNIYTLGIDRIQALVKDCDGDVFVRARSLQAFCMDDTCSRGLKTPLIMKAEEFEQFVRFISDFEKDPLKGSDVFRGPAGYALTMMWVWKNRSFARAEYESESGAKMMQGFCQLHAFFMDKELSFAKEVEEKTRGSWGTEKEKEAEDERFRELVRDIAAGRKTTRK